MSSWRGHVLNKLWERGWAAGNTVCYWCRTPVFRHKHQPGKRPFNSQATTDHIVPVEYGGDKRSISNTVLACHACYRERLERRYNANARRA